MIIETFERTPAAVYLVLVPISLPQTLIIAISKPIFSQILPTIDLSLSED